MLIDNVGGVHTPPVSISATVTSVSSGDRVLVAQSTGSGSTTVNKSQFTLNGAHSIGGTSIVVSGSIPTDTPSSGVVRINDDRYQYSSWAGSTFTLGTPTPALNSAGNTSLIANYSGGTGAWAPLVDDTASSTTISNCGTMTYVSNRNVVYRVRHYTAGAGNSILPFENSGVVNSSGLSVSAIRTVDPVAT